MPLYKCINLDQSNSTIVKEDTQDGTTTVDITSATEAATSLNEDWIARIQYQGDGITELPSELTSIGDYAFAGCDKLALESLPAYIESIGNHAFDGCSSLSFSLNSIPSSITKIGDYAFQDCSSLESGGLPDELTYLGDCAFYGCSNISVEMNLPDSLTHMGSMPFWGTNVIINEVPTTISYFGYAPFAGINVNADYFFANHTSIPNYFFAESLIDWATIPESITSLGIGAFRECKNIQGMDIDCPISTIPDYCFAYCDSLSYVYINNGNTSEIGSYCFSNCSILNYITFSGIETIKTGAFENCSSLEMCSIPESVTSIENYAFENCTSLTDVFFLADDCTNYANWTMRNIFSNCDNIKYIYVNWSEDNDRENGGVITLWKKNYLPNATVTFDAGVQ